MPEHAHTSHHGGDISAKVHFTAPNDQKFGHAQALTNQLLPHKPLNLESDTQKEMVRIHF